MRHQPELFYVRMTEDEKSEKYDEEREKTKSSRNIDENLRHISCDGVFPPRCFSPVSCLLLTALHSYPFSFSVVWYRLPRARSSLKRNGRLMFVDISVLYFYFFLFFRYDSSDMAARN